jgi:hypothetical protein
MIVPNTNAGRTLSLKNYLHNSYKYTNSCIETISIIENNLNHLDLQLFYEKTIL